MHCINNILIIEIYFLCTNQIYRFKLISEVINNIIYYFIFIYIIKIKTIKNYYNNKISNNNKVYL